MAKVFDDVETAFFEISKVARLPRMGRLVFKPTIKVSYLLYGKGTLFHDTDDCFDEDTEFLMLRMKKGIWSRVTKHKTLLRYRVYLMDKFVRTKNRKLRVLHCDTCDHPCKYSMGSCAEGCICCKLPARPVTPTELAPEPADNE